jgi:hypothetical protein
MTDHDSATGRAMHGASGCGRHIARAAALAVAFGLGVAVATTPGIAWADPDSSAGGSSATDAPGQGTDASQAPGGPEPSNVDTPQESSESAGGGTSSETPAAGDSPEVTYGDSDGAGASTVDEVDNGAAIVQEAEAQSSTPGDPAPQTADAAASAVGSTPSITTSGLPQVSPGQDSGAVVRGEMAAPAISRGAAVPAPDRSGAEVTIGLVAGASTMASSAGRSAEAMTKTAALPAIEGADAPTAGDATGLMAVPDTLLNVASGLLTAVLAPLVVSGPASAADTPMLWALLAWARRQFGNTRPSVAGFTPDATDESGNVKLTLYATDVNGAAVSTGPQLSAVAVAIPVSPNGAPVHSAGMTSTVDPDTGWVIGYVFSEDPDDDRVSYSGSGPTPKGSVIVYEDASFLYKPSIEARHDAATMGGDQDTFTITVNDGRGRSHSIPVTVDVLPKV